MESESIIKKLKSEYKDKKILVVGLGIQGGGEGVVRFFAKLGARVTVTDLKSETALKDTLERLKDFNVTYSLGKHNAEEFLSADLIFKGPSVRWNMPEIVQAQKKGIPIEMESSFFASLCPAPIIGVTGTRGKSTTSSLIHALLLKNNLSAYLAGNIPHSSTIELLEKVSGGDIVVLELSSWQLSGFKKKRFSPHVAVFTNFYSDHLNYYENMDEYFSDKEAIFEFQKQGDFLIANSLLKGRLPQRKNIVYFDQNYFPGELKFLKGDHNRENASSAWKVAKILDIQNQNTKEALENFQGLPYRLQTVGKKNNINFINDTTSTTPTATVKALETFEDKIIYIILGGTKKNLPFGSLLHNLSKTKKIYLLKGTFTDEIYPKLKELYPDKLEGLFDDLKTAVEKAFEMAKKEAGKEIYILFSPSATSFGMFKNEFDRGNKFNEIVQTL